MRLHRLVLTGVGPFRDRQEIDFDELSASGLFLIEGPTGSGKTTIIDAIVYAMFGVVSAGGDDVTRMRIRSNYCDDTDPTGVTCEFSVDGRRHRISRVPAGVRDPEEPDKPARSKGPRQALVEFGADGSEATILTARKEIDDHVEALLQMTAEQFRQLVVLPQGQFAELLRKTPAERLSSLAPLLEDAFIAKVQDRLEARGKEAQEQRKLAGTKVDQAAQRLAGRLKSWLTQAPDGVEFTDAAFTDAEASDDERSLHVESLLATLADQAQVAMRERDAQAATALARRAAATEARAVHEALAGVGQARRRVSEALDMLSPDDSDVSEGSIAGRIGELRRREGSLEGHAQWESAASDRHAARQQQAAEAQSCRAQAEARVQEQAAIPAERAGLEQALAELRIVAGAVEQARVEQQRIGSLVAKSEQLAARMAAATALSLAVEEHEAQQLAAERAADDSAAEWERLLDLQRNDAAAALAEALAPGTPCPVCGSIEHPQPAGTLGGALAVTQERVQAARAAAGHARELATEAAKATLEARDRDRDSATLVAGLAGAVGDQTPESLAADHEAAQAWLATCEEAAVELPGLSEQIAALTARERSLREQTTALETRATALEATVASESEAERVRSDEIAATIGDATSATALLRHSRDRIAALTELSVAWVDLATTAGRVPAEQRSMPIDMAAAQAERSAQVADEADGVLADLTERAAVLASMHAEAAPLADGFLDAMAVRREVRAQTTTAIDLAQLVTAGNIKRLQLRSYALQRRFASVLTAASVHLERMSSGKFRFELNEDTAKAGQSGLGISLFDSWTGQPQDPKSLSGGETFYASLALALGLADIVRGEAGGSALETLFVDEGFGSLDQDTLYQVLDQLDQLRAGRRAVGVVSHVTEMKESIAERIEVRRQADSTSVVVRARGD